MTTDRSQLSEDQWQKQFGAWMEQVKTLVRQYLSGADTTLTFEELPDQPYAQWFDEGLDPEDVYSRLLEILGESQDALPSS